MPLVGIFAVTYLSVDCSFVCLGSNHPKLNFSFDHFRDHLRDVERKEMTIGIPIFVTWV